MTRDIEVILLATLGIMVVVAIEKKNIRAAVGEAGQAVNPVNPENIFNRAVNNAGRSISGQSDWTLGGWIYDITH